MTALTGLGQVKGEKFARQYIVRTETADHV